MSWVNLMDKMLGTSVAIFGEDATYYPASGAPYPLRGIFNESYLAVDADTGAEVQMLQPNINVRLSDLVAKPTNRGDQVVIRGVRYSVMNLQQDSEGGARLDLQEID